MSVETKGEEVKSAKSWDSFAETLRIVMQKTQPKEILEYGPGESSKIMLEYDFVERIDSIEHDENYFRKWISEIYDPRFYLHYKVAPDAYANAFSKPYDLVFVDGIERERCIVRASNRVEDKGVVMVHDAERARYHQPMLIFDYIIFTDAGSTATLTNNRAVYDKLLGALIGK